MNNKNITPAHVVIDGQKGALQKVTKSRLQAAALIFTCLYVIVALRLYNITMMASFEEPKIETVRNSHETLEQLHYGRADILDRNGILVATTLPVSSAYVDPKLVADPSKLAYQLSQIIPDLDYADLKSRLSRQTRFVWIKRGLTPTQHKQINAIGDPSINFQKETRRFYPHGALLSHIIGAVNIDGKGQAGLEHSLNNTLSQSTTPLTISIDIRFQYAAQKALQKSINKFDAIGGVAIIADVKTGALLAAVSAPDFDPHHFGQSTGNQTFSRFNNGVYEMGSTFKIFSTAAYLEEKGNKTSDIFDATEALKVGRFQINDFHAQEREMSVADIFLHSSNIGTALMAQDIGTEKLKNTYRDLGFFSASQTRALNSAQPLTPRVWREANTVTASYGHGIAVTPLHLMDAFVTSISDGTSKKTHILTPKHNKNSIETRYFQPATTDIIRRLLRLGVTHGTGQFADLEGYQIGGKTGTSEKIGAQGYDKDKLISSFIAAFPMHDPQYAIYVMVDEPKGREDTYGYATGGWVAAPVIREIAKDIAAIMAMPPITGGEETDNAFIAPLMPYVKDKERKKIAAFLRRGQTDFIPRFIDFRKGESQ